MPKGRYYLSRVVKSGRLNQKMFLDAITKSPTIENGKFLWMITGVVDERDGKSPFVFGRLSKFKREGHVKVVDTILKTEVDSPEENLVEASSPFVYLPKYSGIAYLHVWNGIQENIFPRRLKEMVEKVYHNFFIDCNIESVSDYRMFSSKLKELDLFLKIKAKVYPPNPLFGRLWGSLKSYMDERSVANFKVEEIGDKRKGLNTEISQLMDSIMDNPDFKLIKSPDITDAAILMAADGYGHGSVVGISKGKEVIIRTTETHKSFIYTKEPQPNDFAKEVGEHFSRISKERDMGH